MFHVNPVDKTVVGEIVVHSEGEYIGANSKTGMAYHASQGTGELAVIDGTTNTVVTFIPLTLNGAAYQPYQVAIDEIQNLIYVGAKSPEPEPNGLIPDANGKYGCKAIRELPSDEVPAGEQPELECWHAGAVFVIDGRTNAIVGYFEAGDDPEGTVFAKATGKVYASNEDDGSRCDLPLMAVRVEFIIRGSRPGAPTRGVKTTSVQQAGPCKPQFQGVRVNAEVKVAYLFAGSPK